MNSESMNLLQNFVYTFGLNVNTAESIEQLNTRSIGYNDLKLDNFQNEKIHFSNLVSEEKMHAVKNSNLNLHNVNNETLLTDSSSTGQFNKKETNSEKYLASLPMAENKRMRNMFSTSQIEILEKIFEQTHYPDSSIRNHLSSKLNLSVLRIQVWFQNRRAKFRKLDSQQHNQNKVQNEKKESIQSPSRKNNNLTLSAINQNVNTNNSNMNNSNIFLQKTFLNSKTPDSDYNYSVNFSNSTFPFLTAFSSANSPKSSTSFNNTVTTAATTTFQPLNPQSYLPAAYSTFIQNQNFYQPFHESTSQYQHHLALNSINTHDNTNNNNLIYQN